MPTPSHILSYQQRQWLRELFRTCQWRILIACYKTGVEKETAFPERVAGQLTNAPTEQTTRLCADDIWRKRLYWQGHIDAGDSNNHAVPVMQTHFLIYINDFITIFVWLSNAHINTLKESLACVCVCVPVAVRSRCSSLLLFSPDSAPRLSSFACSEKRRLCFFPETCVFSRRGLRWWFSAAAHRYWLCVGLGGRETPKQAGNQTYKHRLIRTF